MSELTKKDLRIAVSVLVKRKKKKSNLLMEVSKLQLKMEIAMR